MERESNSGLRCRSRNIFLEGAEGGQRGRGVKILLEGPKGGVAEQGCKNSLRGAKKIYGKNVQKNFRRRRGQPPPSCSSAPARTSQAVR